MKTTRRYLTDYDPSKNPPAGTDATAAVFSGLIDVHKKGSRILEKKDPFVYPSSDVILVKQGAIIALYNNLWRTFEIEADIALDATDIDVEGGFTVGHDYYVYLVDDGGAGYLVISENATFPHGAEADNSRKLGGFHFGHIRHTDARYAPVDSTGVAYGANGVKWQDNVSTGIVPNSVWDLHNRPACPPEGMALVGSRWVDIYLSSAAEAVTFENAVNGLYVAKGLLQSKYGQLPVTGTEGLHWYAFQELAARSGKRLQTYAEFVQGAAGNPGGQDTDNDYGWTKTSNPSRARTGCRVSGSGVYDPQSLAKRFAVSAYNLVDCVGNVWEWVCDMSPRENHVSWAYRDVLGADKGKAFLGNDNGLAAFLCGGNWYNGGSCGGRTVYLGNYPWYVSAYTGSRLACDKPAV